MLITKRPRAWQWALALALALGLVLVITLVAVYDTAPRGELAGFGGELRVERGFRGATLRFQGASRTGFCTLEPCLRNRAALDGQSGAAILDERGQIHEVMVNGKLVVSRKDLQDYRNSMLFQFALVFPLFAASLLAAKGLRPTPDPGVGRR